MKSFEIKSVEELVKLIQVIVWGIVVFVLMMVLGGIVATMLYSVTFVTQPIKSMAPIDMAYTKMLNDIVLILASSVTTIVSMFAVNKGIQSAAEKMSLDPKPTTPPTAPPMASAPTEVTSSPKPQAVTVPPQTQSALPDFNWMGYKNPDLDESWTPGPPPETPPNHLEDDSVREAISQARKEA